MVKESLLNQMVPKFQETGNKVNLNEVFE